MDIEEVYKVFLEKYGSQGWWPVNGKYKHGKFDHPKTSEQRLEVCIGAILTQNTNWKNVERVLVKLDFDLDFFLETSQEELGSLIKESGYFNQKARKIKEFCLVVKKNGGIDKFLDRVTRDRLLGIWGIGPETADSILLYAGHRKEFVVDLYTKRIFTRLGLIGDWDYDKIKKHFERLDNTEVYKEFHALIVEHAKQFCKNKPECSGCVMNKECDHYLDNGS